MITVDVPVTGRRPRASERLQRELLLKAARRRELDAILMWRLDREGRSLADLVTMLKELTELGVGFISLTETLDYHVNRSGTGGIVDRIR